MCIYVLWTFFPYKAFVSIKILMKQKEMIHNIRRGTRKGMGRSWRVEMGIKWGLLCSAFRVNLLAKPESFYS